MARRLQQLRRGSTERRRPVARVRRPVGDPHSIVVDLEFADVEAAEAFKGFVETVVWQSRELSPGLDGTPTARALDDVEPARLA